MLALLFGENTTRIKLQHNCKLKWLNNAVVNHFTSPHGSQWQCGCKRRGKISFSDISPGGTCLCEFIELFVAKTLGNDEMPADEAADQHVSNVTCLDQNQ